MNESIDYKNYSIELSDDEITGLATVEFCGDNYMVFWDGELYKDNLTHSNAVKLANRLNETGIDRLHDAAYAKAAGALHV